ncbi:hypothetical protein V6N12_047484 [Hibiscus sabdariffa]|uniref:Uncharacterized protein n=1 Tax=Hibiscus sabdariffa TaxID=183260 RepID=A0ABR2DB02_9ROSI
MRATLGDVATANRELQRRGPRLKINCCLVQCKYSAGSGNTFFLGLGRCWSGSGSLATNPFHVVASAVAHTGDLSGCCHRRLASPIFSSLLPSTNQGGEFAIAWEPSGPQGSCGWCMHCLHVHGSHPDHKPVGVC